MKNKTLKMSLAALACAAVLASCGGKAAGETYTNSFVYTTTSYPELLFVEDYNVELDGAGSYVIHDLGNCLHLMVKKSVTYVDFTMYGTYKVGTTSTADGVTTKNVTLAKATRVIKNTNGSLSDSNDSTLPDEAKADLLDASQEMEIVCTSPTYTFALAEGVTFKTHL